MIEFSPDDWTRYIPLAHLFEGEAQKLVDPPMIAVGEAINGGTNLYAGGITWTDADYDERVGEVLRRRGMVLRPMSFKWQPHSPEQNARARLAWKGGDDISQAWVLGPSDVVNEATELENRMLKRLVEAVHAGRCSVKGRVGPDLHLMTIPAELITPERLLPLGCDELILGGTLYIGVRIELCPQTEIAQVERRCRPAIETMGSNNGALEKAEGDPSEPAGIIPPRHHRDYVLIWELADLMAKEDGKPADMSWLEIMNAFWLGELPALFCFFPPSGGGPGRLLRELPLREVLAAHLRGRWHGVDPIELCAWGLPDYQKDEPFRFYTTRDPRLGFAIRRADFERWRAKHELPRSPAPFDPQEPPRAEGGNEPPADGPTRPPRPLTENVAGQLADKYIAEEKAQGRRPTGAGLEAAVREAGEYRGGREYLRTAFRQRHATPLGRPRKSPK